MGGALVAFMYAIFYDSGSWIVFAVTTFILGAYTMQYGDMIDVVGGRAAAEKVLNAHARLEYQQKLQHIIEKAEQANDNPGEGNLS